MKIEFYYVDEKYVEFLKKAELKERGFTCVPNVQYSTKNKFVYGQVLQIQGKDYFVPVSSKKGKNQQYNLDIKTDDKTEPIKGSLRFPYMIPIPHQCLRKLVIDDIESSNERTKISKELKFCRRNKDKIERYAKNTYFDVLSKKNSNLVANSCDFEILERAYIAFCQSHNIQHNGVAVSTTDVQAVQPQSLLQTENSLLKQEIAELKSKNAKIQSVSDKRAESIRTANAVLSANPELKQAFVAEKQKLLAQCGNSKVKTSQSIQPPPTTKPKNTKH